MHPDPVTWSRQERATRYREQAAQFLEMADAAGSSPTRACLLDLARHYNQLADSLRSTPPISRRSALYGTASSG